MPTQHPLLPLTRREFLKTTSAGLLATAAGLSTATSAMNASKKRPNILMLAVDDLRPQMRCYGVDWMVTPHLDALAGSGTLFQNAYCQFPICGPSRASLMSGVRPTYTRFRPWNARIDKDMPGVLTMPEHFLNNGYTTVSLGKVIHDLDDNEQAWSKKPWLPMDHLGGRKTAYLKEESRAEFADGGMGPPVEAAAVADSAYGDGMIAARAVEELRQLAADDAPFFLSVGYLRPHLPFNAPQKYWDLYDRASLPLAKHPEPPVNVPEIALHGWEELRKYAGMPKQGAMPDDDARMLVHGYAAATSYMDAQVGELLAELDALKLRENTIIVLWADHGWQLGEHGLWAKHCLFERALHTPLMVCAPGMAAGQTAPGLAQNLDIYPTLCELTGLPTPGHVQGTSLVPALKDPATKVHEAVYSRHGDGDSIKTEQYRYSEWRDKEGAILGRMLYDHQRDPEENVNIAEDPDSTDIVAKLAQQLTAFTA